VNILYVSIFQSLMASVVQMSFDACGLLYTIRENFRLFIVILNIKYSPNDFTIGPEFFVIPPLYRNVKVKIYETIILPVVLYWCKTWSLSNYGKSIE
jgi:hypothetical protein